MAYPLRHACFEDLTSQPCCWSVTILACASVRILVTADRLPPVMATEAATAATEAQDASRPWGITAGACRATWPYGSRSCRVRLLPRASQLLRPWTGGRGAGLGATGMPLGRA